MLGSSSIEATENTNEISRSQSRGRATALEESQLIGREKEKADIVNKLISDPSSEKKSVFSVWGMGGLGKTTLVKDVYESQELIGMFEKRAFVTVMRPFILQEFLKSLIMQLSAQSFEKKEATMDFGKGRRSVLATKTVEELIKLLAELLEGKKSLIVLDDFSSTAEWDTIMGGIPNLKSLCKIVVTTREERIAKHCSEKQENIYKLKILEYKDALDLFTKKVLSQNYLFICHICFVLSLCPTFIKFIQEYNKIFNNIETTMEHILSVHTFAGLVVVIFSTIPNLFH